MWVIRWSLADISAFGCAHPNPNATMFFDDRICPDAHGRWNDGLAWNLDASTVFSEF